MDSKTESRDKIKTKSDDYSGLGLASEVVLRLAQWTAHCIGKTLSESSFVEKVYFHIGLGGECWPLQREIITNPTIYRTSILLSNNL